MYAYRNGRNSFVPRRGCYNGGFWFWKHLQYIDVWIFNKRCYQDKSLFHRFRCSSVNNKRKLYFCFKDWNTCTRDARYPLDRDDSFSLTLALLLDFNVRTGCTSNGIDIATASTDYTTDSVWWYGYFLGSEWWIHKSAWIIGLSSANRKHVICR